MDIAKSEACQAGHKQSYKEFKALVKLFQKGLNRKGLEWASRFETDRIQLNLMEQKNKAYEEINHLLTTPNNGRETLISELESDFQEIAEEFERLIEIHGLRGIDLQSLSENKQSALRAFRSFYDQFHELQASLNKLTNGTQPNNLSSLPEYLNHEQSEQLASELKKEFGHEKGKGLRFMLEALSELEVLKGSTHENRKDLTKALSNSFDKELNRQAIFKEEKELDWEFKSLQNDKDYQNARQKVKQAITKAENPKAIQ